MVAIVGLLGAVNCLLMPVIAAAGSPGFGIALLLAAMFGAIAAEAGVLAVWLVWCEWPLSLRLALHWLAALFLFGCWVLGSLAAWQADPYYPDRFLFQPKLVVATAAALPPISLAVQIPLWLCRLVFGWRLVRTAKSQRPPTESKLSIRDLLVGTSVVAASLGCLRLVALDPQQIEARYWALWGLGVLALIAVSAVVLLSLVAIVLRPAASETAAALMLICSVGIFGAVFIPFLLAMRTIGPGIRPPPHEPFLVISVFLTSFGGTLAAPLWLARSYGYRLRFRRDRA
jgi:hypothetical protein